MGDKIFDGSPKSIARALDLLRQGGLVAVPTETVYGLAANAADGEAVAHLYAAKGRPSFNPLIAHVASIEMAMREGVFRPEAKALVEELWPGPLTVVVNVAETGTVSDLARAGLDTVALRMPAHPVALSLLTEFGAPLVAPSANPSGQISPTTAAHVAADMVDKVDMILDGGTCRAGIESTIIDVRGDTPALLRPGSLDPAQIEAIWPGLVRPALNPNVPQSPGQLLRHYAPRAALRLNARKAAPDEALLGFGATPGATLNLSPDGRLDEAAANLFSMLRQLDETCAQIAVAPVPDTGLGEAINDRLTRAAKSA
ncbi:MAG: L-threonylcarbamoyladenylate synthase [Pseudomonadota bacterium]